MVINYNDNNDDNNNDKDNNIINQLMSYHYGFIIGLLTLMLLIMVVGWVDGCKVNAINHPYFDGVYMFIPPIYGKIGVYFTIALLTLNH